MQCMHHQLIGSGRPANLILMALVVIGGLAQPVRADCFDNSGTLRTDWLPCYPDDEVSFCCHEADFCMSNGLCLNTGVESHFSLQACSDKSFPEPCKSWCAIDENTNSSADYGGFEDFEFCDPTESPFIDQCCGVGCCGQSDAATQRIQIASSVWKPGSAPTGTPATTTTTVTAGAATTSSPSKTGQEPAQETPTGSEDSRDPDPLVLGLGVGLGVGIPCLVAAATFAFLWLRIRREHRMKLQEQRHLGGGAYFDPAKGAWEAGSMPYMDMAGSGTTAELPGAKYPHELSAGTPVHMPTTTGWGNKTWR